MTTITEAQDLIAFCRARLRESTSPLDAAMSAAWPGLPEGVTLDEARRRTAAALAAAGIDDTALVLRQTIALYEQATGMVEMLRAQGGSAKGHEIAAESYLNVIRLHAARWATHPDYRESFHCGWMDDLQA